MSSERIPTIHYKQTEIKAITRRTAAIYLIKQNIAE